MMKSNIFASHFGLTLLIGLMAIPIQAGVVITSHPSDKETHVGGSAAFSITLSSSAMIQWQKNGVNIVGANSSSLSMAGVAKIDEGFYRAQVTTSDGYIYSHDARLTVNYSPAQKLPRLLKDVAHGKTLGSTAVSHGHLFKGKLYFRTRPPGQNYQLWSTDGTPSNTRVFHSSTYRSESDYWYIGQNDTDMYYIASFETSWAIMSTDGSSSPPTKVLDLQSHLDLSSTHVTNDGLYYSRGGNDGIWFTDGTPSGTHKISNLTPRRPNGNSPEQTIVEVGGNVYFVVSNAFGTQVLAMTSGTPESAAILTDDEGNELERPKGLNKFGNTLFFLRGTRLAMIRGTPSSSMTFSDTNIIDSDHIIGAIGGEVYFYGRTFGGSVYGVNKVTVDNQVVNATDENFKKGIIEPAYLKGRSGNKIVYGVGTSTWGFYTTDGTASRSHQIHGPPPAYFTQTNDQVFFTSSDDEYGAELWVSNGTSGSTRLVKDIYPGPAHSMAGGDHGDFLEIVNGKILFRANDGINGETLWISDGSEAGTRQFPLPFQYPLTGSSDLEPKIGANGQFFLQTDYSLNVTNGTEAGTTSIKFFRGRLPQPSSAGNYIFYNYDKSLWRSDGTSAGTIPLKTSFDWISPMSFGVGNTCYFPAGFNGVYSMWKSDGTESGTTVAFDIDNSHSVGAIVPNTQRNLLFYMLDDSRDSWLEYEPWVYNATNNTHYKLAEIYPGLGGSDPTGFVDYGSHVWFGASTSNGTHLYKTNGLAGQVSLVKTVTPSNSHSIQDMRAAANGLFFRVDSDLWFSDTTTDGTESLTDQVMPGSLTVVGSQCFFISERGPTGMELWVSDGTSSGTHTIMEISRDSVNPIYTGMVSYDGLLYFTNHDAQHGTELWTSDGTDGGTKILTDVQPGSLSSKPLYLSVFDQRIYMSMDNGVWGREPWVIDQLGTILISSQPKYQIIQAGDSVQLSLSAEGSNLTYQWYRGDRGDTSQPLGSGASIVLLDPVEGHYWCRVSNNVQSIDSKVAGLRVLSPFQWWMITTYPTHSHLLVDSNLDPDDDDLSNLLEYAFGSNPHSRDVGYQPQIRREIVDGNTVMVGTFRRVAGDANLQYLLQVSEDLTNWSDLTEVEPTRPTVDLGNGFEEVSFQLPPTAGSCPCQYFRIQVVYR